MSLFSQITKSVGKGRRRRRRRIPLCPSLSASGNLLSSADDDVFKAVNDEWRRTKKAKDVGGGGRRWSSALALSGDRKE